MGLFENLGRKVEEFKQQAEQASAEEAPYRCGECGELLYTEHDECPECGSDRIRSRETEENGVSGGGARSEAERETDADSDDADADSDDADADTGREARDGETGDATDEA